MQPISVWGRLGDHDDGKRSMGEFGQDARVTPLLFFEGHPGIFNDHRESGPRFNVSVARGAWFSEVCSGRKTQETAVSKWVKCKMRNTCV